MTVLKNMYDDSGFATSYALLGIQGTYYLAYRDLPEIFKRYTSGNRALDFGCGAGRSTKVLCELGYRTEADTYFRTRNHHSLNNFAKDGQPGSPIGARCADDIP